MARVVRLIIYESDDKEKLTKQIEKSLSLGVHNLAVKITIHELSTPKANEVIRIHEYGQKLLK